LLPLPSPLAEGHINTAFEESRLRPHMPFSHNIPSRLHDEGHATPHCHAATCCHSCAINMPPAPPPSSACRHGVSFLPLHLFCHIEKDE
jgi:hypothetical protein